jgi:hypothetical protein
MATLRSASSPATRGWRRLAAMLTLAATMPMGMTPAGAAPTSVDQRVALAADGVLAVTNVAGQVLIRGWDRAEAQVSGTLGEGVERLDVRKDGDRLVVRVVLRRGASQRDGKANLELSVPRSVRLEVSTVSAGVDVAEVGGEQRLNSVSGDIRLDGGGASTEVKTVSGDVLLRGSEQGTALRIATVSGDVRIERGGGSLEANTVSGDLRLGLGAIRSLRLRSTSGDIEVRATAERGSRVEAESVSGDVDLSLIAPAGIELEAESFSGAIASCFGARGEATRTPSPGRSLRSVRGDGGSQVRIKTMSGDIDVCDR